MLKAEFSWRISFPAVILIYTPEYVWFYSWKAHPISLFLWSVHNNAGFGINATYKMGIVILEDNVRTKVSQTARQILQDLTLI